MPFLKRSTLLSLLAAGANGLANSLKQPGQRLPADSFPCNFWHRRKQNYTTFYPCSELPVRGYTTLCLNNAQIKTGLMNDLDLETMMSDVGAGVQFLRAMGDIDKVIVWGHSGGGAIMAAYQDVAENGASACNGTEKIYPCSSARDGPEPADGVLLIDANHGLSTMTLLSLNPAVTNSSEAVNLYSPANGWTEAGANYTSSFVKEFYAAVASRWNGLVDSAVQHNQLIPSGNATYTGDKGLVIADTNYIGFNNKIISQDTRFLSHTAYKWPLLHKSNRTTTQIVPSTTVTRFLSAFTIRVDAKNLAVSADNITGVDWASSQMAPISSVAGVSVPLLTTGNTRHYEYLSAEKIYLAATKTTDKIIAFVEGAQHTINTCTECETYPGEFGDMIRTAFDYMDVWLGKPGRFISA
ncbi:predicted protein [Aspergillus nidulans FGSC A4]|uniref:AB hydrolase-1 domain-containing protein n=1 Tax=Emericella nidulans (strain FGSC A4 / ATCC 38163 / CBS 112.46 / NRRL 194 / M139) TaxID=227321 RepID=Q5BAN6_EMENI|nr:hypothetical protein [Aspergillus nidulans FGSC A4]EAA64505.1 predicted protein [Aspergillus nidulans FGSC A4]CBF86755.1 TPA: conserved hypothetical protein [Aspergillus nidulans FGSC A4]|eukprot:XP_659998.1 predicted protein [Aspergillus nidulans FGSC A4]